MSRIGKQPITVPEGVTISLDPAMGSGQVVSIKGPKGELAHTVHRDIAVQFKDGVITCEIARNSKQATALWGTTRAILANMVTGVSEGFQKQLELHGVGYRAAVKGKDLELQVGYSHPVIVPAPDGIVFSVEKDIITIQGFDSYRVGQITADIRATRPPEPYKGKGIRYVGEKVRRKVGKVVGSAS